MARKGKWLPKVTRFLTCTREDISNESNRRAGRERRKARRIQKQGERNSFISRFKEPTSSSSIEKILEEAEREQGLTFRPPSLLEQPKKPSVVLPRAASPRSISPRATSPRAATPRIISPKATSPSSGSLRVIIPRARSPRAVSPRGVSPRDVSPVAGSPKGLSSGVVSPKPGSSMALSPRLVHRQDVSPTPSPPRPPSSRAGFSKAASFKMIHREESVIKIDPVFPYHHVSAKKIQAAYRGYMSRKRTGSGRGLLRLQQFVRGQSVRRQIANVMKQMQHLVRVQTRLRSQSFRMLECYALQHQEQHKTDKQAESIASDAGYTRDWDNSVLTKEEKEARNKRKEEAVKNKERAMAFLQTHQISKVTSESAQSGLIDLWIDGLPWSWNWSECHMLKVILPVDHAKKNPSSNPPMSVSPRSTRSSIAPRGNQFLTSLRNSRSQTPSRFSQMQTPDGTPRSHYSSRSLLTKYLKPTPRGSRSPFDMHLTDTDSLKSCPAFSVPHYMSPTASARAKMRESNNFKDRYVSSPSTESKRRMSYPLTPLSGTSRVPLFPDTDASSQRTVGTNRSSRSIDNISVGTPGSLADGRKPFNRFV
uniref:DUF4005 domain-containing protein n=1 Tax=Kalanchoe fedtschenkoi TaxID=63787 RepID=A0A7N0ZXN5_KALFE